MGANQLLIKKAGLYTSIQDLGRTGFMNKGVARSGAIDTQSASLANWLVGNDANTALLETTFQGLTVQFQDSRIIAIAGGDLGAHLNNRPVTLWESVQVGEGDVLAFDKKVSGFRAYLAISGGIKQSKIMGSRSTHSMIDLGIEKIKDGSILELYSTNSQVKRSSSESHRPVYTKHFTARLLPGPEFESFPREYMDQLTTQQLTISPDSNRMGYRLIGDFDSKDLPQGILSSGVIPGTIQVTPSGQPIILMNDGPTTGGYARVGNVITPDLNYIAQLAPGDLLRFTWVNFDQADRILKNYRDRLSEAISVG